MAPPFKQAEFDILYGEGISREGDIIDMGVDLGVVRKSGAWYTYDGDQLGQGKEKVRQFLKDNPEMATEIEGKILAKVGIGVDPDAVEEAEVPEDVDFDAPVWAALTREPRELSIEEQREKARDISRAAACHDGSPLSRPTRAGARTPRVPEEISEEVLQHFEEIGLINDAHFAQVLTRTRFAEKGASRRAILDELHRKGVARNVAEQAVKQIDAADEFEAAVTLAMKKMRSASGNPETPAAPCLRDVGPQGLRSGAVLASAA